MALWREQGLTGELRGQLKVRERRIDALQAEFRTWRPGTRRCSRHWTARNRGSSNNGTASGDSEVKTGLRRLRG
jgi:hypothetical protein